MSDLIDSDNLGTVALVLILLCTLIINQGI